MKTLLEVFKDRVKQAEERTSRFEDRTMEIINSEKRKKK